MLDSRNETAESSYSFDGPVSFETLDSISDERLLKKIKEEQLIKKIRKEIELPKPEVSSSSKLREKETSKNGSYSMSTKDAGKHSFFLIHRGNKRLSIVNVNLNFITCIYIYWH